MITPIKSPIQNIAAIAYASFGSSSPILINGILSKLNEEIEKAIADSKFSRFIFLCILDSSSTNIKRFILSTSMVLGVIEEERNKPTSYN